MDNVKETLDNFEIFITEMENDDLVNEQWLIILLRKHHAAIRNACLTVDCPDNDF